jgi:hypothetical protein
VWGQRGTSISGKKVPRAGSGTLLASHGERQRNARYASPLPARLGLFKLLKEFFGSFDRQRGLAPKVRGIPRDEAGCLRDLGFNHGKDQGVAEAQLLGHEGQRLLDANRGE